MLFPVITIRQPWAWLILQQQLPVLRKNVENRNWKLPAQYLNAPVLVHTSQKFDCNIMDVVEELQASGCDKEVNAIVEGLRHGHGVRGYAMTGHIVGVVRFKCCWFNKNYDSPFHQQPERFHLSRPSVWCSPESKYWWEIAQASPVKPVAAKGRLGFWQFDYPYPEELEVA